MAYIPRRRTTIAVSFFIFLTILILTIAVPTISLQVIDQSKTVFELSSFNISLTSGDIVAIMSVCAGSMAMATFLVTYFLPQVRKARSNIKKRF